MAYKFRWPYAQKRRLLTIPFSGQWRTMLDYWAKTYPAPVVPGSPTVTDYPGTTMPNATYEAMLAEAQSYIGYSYTWGGKTPPYFDCSGYVGYLYKKYGLMPDTVVSYTGTIYAYLKDYQVDESEARAGDIAIWGGSSTGTADEGNAHVAIYIGNGYVLDASGNAVGYRTVAWHGYTRFLGYFRCPDL